MLRILIVDDEALVRRGIVMETDWDSIDCTVVGEAANGNEGIEAVHRCHPDIIVCDIRMSGMDGIEMLTHLRNEGNMVPVIFLTAYSDFEYTQRAIRLSAADYILKPYEDGELEKTIRRIKTKIRSEGSKTDNESEMLLLSDSVRKGDKSAYVTEAIDYIREHYDDPDLNIRMIAEDIGLSEGHLSHVFKKETDYTVNDYLTRYRIQSAMKLLTNCRFKVYEIAEKVGYRDIAYFSTTFKKLTGVNPSEYQDRVRSR